ncbi:MAG TPA: AAA family ATPase, partial [Puia sp.]|nr:AAA family ATPase [Puia sp.]
MKWSKDPYRKPLVLRGARQVGKTTAVAAFAKNFKQYIYLNLENPADRDAFILTKGIQALVESIFISKGKDTQHGGDTLVFIDEIQQVPGALNMLRYFYEEYPQIKVIAAGSLLETILNKNTQVPVGRIDYRVMRPVSFPEFLGAIDKKQALRELRKIPVNGFAHSTLLGLFHTYALIGGMPEVVNRYASTNSVSSLSPVYEQLIKSYMDDVEKYGRNDTLIKVIRHCIRACFTEAGKRIKFQHFGQSQYNSREIGESLRL